MSEIREILYRGLHRCKGEKVRLDGTPVESKWVYGGVCQFKGERSIIYQIEPEIDKFTVYTDTLGQFTGLYDSTKWESLPESEQKEWLKSHTADEWQGRKIFEGDIIEYQDDIERYSVVWDEEAARFVVADYEGKKGCDFLFYTPKKCKIIGNIHDNPELLK